MSIFLLPFFIWVGSLVWTQHWCSVVISLQLLTSDTRLLLVSGDQLVSSLIRSLRKGWYQFGLCVQWTAWFKKGLLVDEECGSNSALCFLMVWRLANVAFMNRWRFVQSWKSGVSLGKSDSRRGKVICRRWESTCQTRGWLLVKP